jgi:hypothetical protein
MSNENNTKDKMLILAKNLDGYLACENFAKDLRAKINENIKKEEQAIQERIGDEITREDHYNLGRIEALQDLNAMIDSIYKESVYSQYSKKE